MFFAHYREELLALVVGLWREAEARGDDETAARLAAVVRAARGEP